MSLTGHPALRLGSDLAALAVLAVYLGSPALFGHPSLAASRPRGTPGAATGRFRESELQREPG